MPKIQFSQKFTLLGLILLALIVRLYKLESIPAGYNWDELGNSYESYSLLKTGADRWGNTWPAYFPAWGSGQSVLLGYLKIPFLVLFSGLNVWSIRLPMVILGVLNVYLIYALGKRWYGWNVGILSGFMMSFFPWSVVTSRVAIDANILPTFVLLGLLTVTQALTFSEKQELKFLQKLSIVFGLVPFAMALYSYGISFLPILLFFPSTFWIFKNEIFRQFKLWIISLIIWASLSTPFWLFFIKNYILKTDLPFEKWLPFSIPMLPGSRLTQINENQLETIAQGIYFLFSGFPDSLEWNNTPGFLPLTMVIFPFLGLGIYEILKSIKDSKIAKKTRSLGLIWLITFLPTLVLAPLNSTRANSILPLALLFTAIGWIQLSKKLKTEESKRVFFTVSFGWLLVQTVIVQINYFYLYPKYSGESFQQGLDLAFREVKSVANEDEKIYLTQEVPINYIYALTYLQVDPTDFRKNADYSIRNGDYNVFSWQNYYFRRDKLNPENGESWLAILKPCKNQWCEQFNILYNYDKCFRNEQLWQDNYFIIYRCHPKNSNQQVNT